MKGIKFLKVCSYNVASRGKQKFTKQLPDNYLVLYFIANGYILRMSALFLQYKVYREVSHILLQRNKTKHRRDQRGFLVCSQGFHQRKCTLYDGEYNVQPSSILCIHVSIPPDTRYDLVSSFVKHV